MKHIIIFLFSMSFYTLVCKGQNTRIYYNNVNSTISTVTSFGDSMYYRDGYDAGELKMFMVNDKDTCALFSSIGITQFSVSTSELSSDVNIYCWPASNTAEEKYTCEGEPRVTNNLAELSLNFHFESEKELTCSVSFDPDKLQTIDRYNHDIDSMMTYPHYFVDNIYDIVCGMISNGTNKKEIEEFMDAFDKHLDPVMLDMKKGYGVDYGHYYGYGHYKYCYYLLKALLHLSSASYVGKDIVKLNDDLNRFYRENSK